MVPVDPLHQLLDDALQVSDPLRQPFDHDHQEHHDTEPDPTDNRRGHHPTVKRKATTQ